MKLYLQQQLERRCERILILTSMGGVCLLFLCLTQELFLVYLSGEQFYMLLRQINTRGSKNTHVFQTLDAIQVEAKFLLKVTSSTVLQTISEHIINHDLSR